MLREIGRGTTGVVYLGQDPLQRRPVALKVAHTPEVRDESARALLRSLFFNEMRTATILSHPNIVEVLDAGVDGTNHYIAMEYIDGSATLEQWCRPDNLLSVERAAEVVNVAAVARAEEVEVGKDLVLEVDLEAELDGDEGKAVGVLE